MGARKHYEESFKAQAVRLVTEQGYSVRKAASRLGVNLWTLRDWVRKAQDKLSPQEAGIQSNAANELNALRSQVRQLQMENEILKKATAYFAKDSL
jgi:transposase